jgi:hypothetical protein
MSRPVLGEPFRAHRTEMARAHVEGELRLVDDHHGTDTGDSRDSE